MVVVASMVLACGKSEPDNPYALPSVVAPAAVPTDATMVVEIVESPIDAPLTKAERAAEKKRVAAEEQRAREAAEKEEREAAVGALKRRVHLQLLSREMAEHGIEASFEAVGPNFDAALYLGICGQKTLEDLAARMRSSFIGLGFREMRCSGLTVSYY
jgi:hypothetical protein